MDPRLSQLEKETTLRAYCRTRPGFPEFPSDREPSYGSLLETLKGYHEDSYAVYKDWERVFETWVERISAYEKDGEATGYDSDSLALAREVADEMKRSALGIG